MTAALEFSADFPTKFFKKTKLPYLSSMRAFYLLGTDAASSLQNRVPNSPNPTATAVGAPAYGTGYATVNGLNNRILGGFNSTASPFTHIVVVNTPWSAGEYGCMCGYWTIINLPNYSSALIWVGTGVPQFWLEQPGPANSFAALGGFAFNAGASKFAFFAAVYDGATMTIYGHNGKRLGVGSVAAASPALAGQPFVIGGNIDGAQNRDFNVAAAGTANVALTQAQLLEQYAYLKELCTARGVAML